MAKTKGSSISERIENPYLDEDVKKSLADRLARIDGHIRAIREMVLEHRCADEILLQVSAVKAALNKFSAVLLDKELKACMDTCMAGDAEERLDKVTKVLATLLKQT